MPPAVGSAMLRVAAVIPVVLLVLFTGVLWLLGLMCGRERRQYVIILSQQAMSAVGVLLHGSPALAQEAPTPAPYATHALTREALPPEVRYFVTFGDRSRAPGIAEAPPPTLGLTSANSSHPNTTGWEDGRTGRMTGRMSRED